MQHRAEEHDSARPPVDEVQLLVPVSWTEQERDDGVLRRK